MEKIAASIITIGDELLIGQVVDTNSAWMAKQLNSIGVWVSRRIAVGDVWNEIWRALDEESKYANIILITGGLGPTADDITKPLLCEYFEGRMIINEAALANVKNIFENYIKRPLLESNFKQAEVPDVCTVIQNMRGTAPGMWFSKNEKIFISMPGVPYEMQGMMTDYVLPKLKEQFAFSKILHKTLITYGIGESFIAEMIKDFETNLPEYLKLAYLPNYGMVRLRLTANADSSFKEEELENKLNTYFFQLKDLVKEHLLIDEDIPMQEVIGRLLKQQNKTLATAESCTGGYIAHLITSVAGSSGYFYGSVVSYDNSIKQRVLNVSKKTLITAGAVSEETVTEMVKGTLQIMQTDYAIAVSGIMGPGGGTLEKPVGTVWIAAGNNQKIETRTLYFRFDRKRNIELTAINALNLLRQVMLS